MLFMHTGAGTFTLGGGMFQRSAGGLLLSVALAFIVSIISAVATQAKSAQFKDARYLRQ